MKILLLLVWLLLLLFSFDVVILMQFELFAVFLFKLCRFPKVILLLLLLLLFSPKWLWLEFVVFWFSLYNEFVFSKCGWLMLFVFVPIRLFLKTVEEVLEISDAVEPLLLCPCWSTKSF